MLLLVVEVLVVAEPAEKKQVKRGECEVSKHGRVLMVACGSFWNQMILVHSSFPRYPSLFALRLSLASLCF